MRGTIDKDTIRIAAEEDLLTFAKLVNPNRVYGRVHEDLFRWWEREGASTHQLVLLPRDHQKSHCIAIRCAWEITRNPDVTILYVSATADLAEKQLLAIKNILTSRTYKRYWPEMVNQDDAKRELWNVSEIAVDHPKRQEEGVRDATVKSAGLTTNVTGFHANIIVLDDVVVPANAYTENGRESVEAAYSMMASVGTTGHKSWVVGTRYHPKDLYNQLISMEEEIYDSNGELVSRASVYDTYQRQVEEEGEFLWPRQMRADGRWFGFDQRELARKRAQYLDRTQFYAQYYNNPNNPETSLIDRSRFQYYNRKHISRNAGVWYYKDKPLNVYASIDFAFSLRKGADYTALVVIGIDPDGMIYVLDIDRFKSNKISEYFEHIKQAHIKWGFRKFRAEVTVAQAAVVAELRAYIRVDGLRLSIDEFRPTRAQGSKAERINAMLEPRYANQTVWHYEGGLCSSLEEELMMEHPPHDDIKDALAAAVEIAVPPRNHRSLREGTKSSNVIYHSRFGGVN